MYFIAQILASIMTNTAILEHSYGTEQLNVELISSLFLPSH